MSSDNASSAVTYTSVSSDSNGSSWGNLLVNAGELPEMDPYEEVAQQGQTPPLSPAYVPDPMKLDEHVPVYVLEPEHPEYHEDSIDYPDEPEDDDEDPEEDPSEEHEPEDEARISVRPQIPMAASTQALIDAFAAGLPQLPLPPTSPVYDQAPLVESSDVASARAPRDADRIEDVGYVRALQASKHRMVTSIEEVNLRVSYQVQVRRRESEDFYKQLLDARTDRRDIRLEIDVVRGQRTTYEIEFHEARQAYLSSEAQNRALLARLETLETHMSRMEWQRQSAEGRTVKHMICTQELEARA
ncbi:hypothetical protein Tco_1152422 [Tanacetum coccineum]